MIYLFEDKLEDSLSKLFRYSLPDSVKDSIEYSDGNGNLVKRAEELLNQHETVVVILDTVPANKSIRDIYIALRRLSRQHDYRLIVWNILCAEYYFITAFGRDKNIEAFKSNQDYELISGILPYKESSLIETEEDKAFSKTFEKFCKLYLRKNGGQCIYPEDTFFTDDCRCATDCKKMKLKDKSENYRSAYKLFWNLESDMEKLWSLHKELLKITNDAIERYNTAGYQNIKVYPAIVS